MVKSVLVILILAKSFFLISDILTFERDNSDKVIFNYFPQLVICCYGPSQKNSF